MTQDSIEAALQLAKVALPMQPGSWIGEPDEVARFIDVLAARIDDLYSGKTAKS